MGRREEGHARAAALHRDLSNPRRVRLARYQAVFARDWDGAVAAGFPMKAAVRGCENKLSER